MDDYSQAVSRNVRSIDADLFELLEKLPSPLLAGDNTGSCLFLNRAMRDFLQLAGEIPSKLVNVWPNWEEQLRLSTEQAFVLRGADVRSCRGTCVELCGGRFLLLLTPEPVASSEDTNRALHAQRLQTLGMLASGVAHDFNNILAGLLGHVSYLQTVLPANGIHTESLGAIEDGSRRASLLTQQILNFSKLEVGKSQGAVNLGELIQRTGVLLRGALSPRYTLTIDVPKDPVWVEGVEGRLAQVLVNLVMNSRDAVDNNGHIGIVAKLAQDSSRSSDSKQWALLEVSDNGTGIPAELLPRVFEPYFSTKGDHGTGLGLATVHQVIEECGGELRIDTSPERGTTVKIYLPLAITPSETPQVPAKPKLQGGSERILVVDDEDSVRAVLEASLKRLGYSVVAVAEGSVAVELFSSQGPFDLVVVDMLMPGMSGEEVIWALREINHQLRALLISGYVSDDVLRRLVDSGNCSFLLKPFTVEQLAEQVRAVLTAELSVIDEA